MRSRQLAAGPETATWGGDGSIGAPTDGAARAPATGGGGHGSYAAENGNRGALTLGASSTPEGDVAMSTERRSPPRGVTPLPTLAAPRVVLRWLVPADRAALVGVFSDREVRRFWGGPVFDDEAGAQRLLDEIAAGRASGGLFQWGVARREDDRVIGTCTLAHIDAANRRAEIGFGLARRWWGHGLMTEGVTALLDHAFDDLALHRVEADVDPRNAASIKLLERHGFVREGQLRERWFVGGETQDTVFFGLLAREWRARPRGA